MPRPSDPGWPQQKYLHVWESLLQTTHSIHMYSYNLSLHLMFGLPCRLSTHPHRCYTLCHLSNRLLIFYYEMIMYCKVQQLVGVVRKLRNVRIFYDNTTWIYSWSSDHSRGAQNTIYFLLVYEVCGLTAALYVNFCFMITVSLRLSKNIMVPSEVSLFFSETLLTILNYLCKLVRVQCLQSCTFKFPDMTE